jgi:DNA-binding transcriptional ArsR family regulator
MAGMKEQDDGRDEALASIMNALSEPNRIRMIRTLARADGELSCAEVGDSLNISKSTVSYHFKLLRAAGLTNTRREGQTKYLSINTKTFDTYLPGFLQTL